LSSMQRQPKQEGKEISNICNDIAQISLRHNRSTLFKGASHTAMAAHLHYCTDRLRLMKV